MEHELKEVKTESKCKLFLSLQTSKPAGSIGVSGATTTESTDTPEEVILIFCEPYCMK